MLKGLQARLQQYVNQELPDVHAVQRQRTRDQIANIAQIIEKAREFQKNIYYCFIDHTKAFDCVTNCGKFLKRWDYHTTWPASWAICMQVTKQQLEVDMEQWNGSSVGKESVKAVYCHPACLIYMQSKSCYLLVWMTHKLQSRFPGEISITSVMEMTPPLWQKVKRN